MTAHKAFQIEAEIFSADMLDYFEYPQSEIIINVITEDKNICSEVKIGQETYRTSYSPAKVSARESGIGSASTEAEYGGVKMVQVTVFFYGKTQTETTLPPTVPISDQSRQTSSLPSV